MPPPITEIDQRDTHRLIPAQFADGGASVLTRLTVDEELLEGIFQLDNATNDRLLAESDLLSGIDARELVFGIPSYRIINAAYCHAPLRGSRFGSPQRNAWYAAFELGTSIAEVAYHKRLWLEEIGWSEDEVCDYVDYLADFHANFHDIRAGKAYSECLDPLDCGASQALAVTLLAAGSAGIVYPSARQARGTCIACFRPVLVTNVRIDSKYRFLFSDPNSQPSVKEL